ncbi:hypothetical protein HN873_062371 [Arachis hypogaea]
MKRFVGLFPSLKRIRNVKIVLKHLLISFLILSPVMLCTWIFFDLMGEALILKIQSAFIQRAIRFFIFVGCDGLIILWIAGLLSVAAGEESLHMMMAPAGGGDGSGAGSSQRPVHLDLNLPPGGRDELNALVAELDRVEEGIRRLTESPADSRELELRRLEEVLGTLDSRLEQARAMDSARDQALARQRAELHAQMEPFLQGEVQLAARRQALAEVANSLLAQVQAQDLFLQETGELADKDGQCSRGCEPDGTKLGFGRYGTQSCRAGRLSYRAIEAARRAIIGHFHRAMSGQFRKNGKIWVRVFADIPITGKPTEVRMGRGKGNPTGWIARVSTGQVLFEMDGVNFANAQQAATLAAHKPCSSTKFVKWS